VRIVAGSLGGREIQTPRGAATRPTADKVRQAIFNILAARWGEEAIGAVLDLYAGSGAMGLEALSRGAASAVFVDQAAAAARCILANARALDLEDRVRVVRADVDATLGRLAERYDLVFVDPPYAAGAESALAALPPLVEPSGLVVVEHDRRRPPAAGYGDLARFDRRRYGDTEVSFYRRPGEEPA
jgi:16S rRNA (guanine(966)-N(2))-methyltransferase RsmD